MQQEKTIDLNDVEIHNLHVMSLDVARQYHHLLGKISRDQSDGLMQAAIGIRRCIPKGKNSKRHGHKQYYRWMSEGRIGE